MAQELSPESKAVVQSFIPYYSQLSPEERNAEAVKIISQDFFLYCEFNLMIRNKKGQIVPLVLNDEQTKLVHHVMQDLAAGRPVRYIILKDRQIGVSTVIEALCMWWTTTHRNTSAMIMAHEAKAAKNLYEMSRRYYDFSHPFFQPDRKYNTRESLVFDVTDEVKDRYAQQGMKHPGLGSSIMTLVAKEGAGRSFTGSFLHASEVAFWEGSADATAAVFQTIPMLPGTFIFLESTANGIGGYFYDEWQLAVKGKSSFKPLFFAWHEHDEYQIPGTVSVLDDEEIELIDLFKDLNYDPATFDSKILWRREKQKDFRTDPKKFYQEYPATDMEAFLASGRPVFDIKQLSKMERYATDNPSHIFGGLLPNTDPTTMAKEPFILQEVPVTFQDQDPTPLKIWDKPQKNEKYTIGIDVADGIAVATEGGKKTDFSVIDVMDSNLKTVARWHGHIDPDQLGEIAFAIGHYYNKALIGVEVNNHGLTTVQSLRNKFYRNLYMRETSEDEMFQERTSRMGWLTNRKTKELIINNLVTAIREGVIFDLDIVFIRECMTYVRDDQGRTNAQAGLFDDTVMAKAINLEMAQFNSLNQTVIKDRIKKDTVLKNGRANDSNSIFDPDANGFSKPGSSRSKRIESVIAKRRKQRATHTEQKRKRNS